MYMNAKKQDQAPLTHECKKAKAGAYGKKEMAFGELAASEGAQIQPSP